MFSRASRRCDTGPPSTPGCVPTVSGSAPGACASVGHWTASLRAFAGENHEPEPPARRPSTIVGTDAIGCRLFRRSRFLLNDGASGCTSTFSITTSIRMRSRFLFGGCGAGFVAGSSCPGSLVGSPIGCSAAGGALRQQALGRMAPSLRAGPQPRGVGLVAYQVRRPGQLHSGRR